jgi:YggT family protein
MIAEEEKRTVIKDGDGTRITQEEPAGFTVARVIYFIGGFIMSILALRFLLRMLGANQGNAFVDLIYGISRPFVAPFFGMFNYTPQYGNARLELETLFAILIYGLITYALVRLLTIGRHSTV